MAKRNHIFIAARNRKSAGPMSNKKNKRSAVNNEEQDFYDFVELNRIVANLLSNNKDYSAIHKILSATYTTEQIDVSYDEVISVNEMKGEKT